MQEGAHHPNNLQRLLDIAGYTQLEAAQDSGVPLGTLRHYLRGEQIIGRKDRQKLAHILCCNVQDLAPQYDSQGGIPGRLEDNNTTNERIEQPTIQQEEWDGCFSFGKIQTSSMVLDGYGVEAYLPANIRTHYDPQPAQFFEEVVAAKKQIEAEERQKTGDLWNSEKYHLSKIVVAREPIHEHMTLGLWFKPRDHYTGLATRRCLDDPHFREKYLSDHDWYEPVVGMSMSMGVDMMVISSDGQAILTQRGMNQSVHRGMLNCSVSEAVSPLLDRSTTSQAPDLYRCAARGFAEELGLRESVDFRLSDILFLSFTVDVHYALYGLRGMLKVSKTADEILQGWHAGVKDKRENGSVFAVPFTPHDICEFVYSHHTFAPGGLVCLYHTLAHEFGREEIEQVLSSLDK